MPLNDIDPWVEAIRELVGDKERYEDVRCRGREKALAYVKGLTHEFYEKKMLEAAEGVKVDVL